jgi:hypothetical protein
MNYVYIQIVKMLQISLITEMTTPSDITRMDPRNFLPA